VLHRNGGQMEVQPPYLQKNSFQKAERSRVYLSKPDTDENTAGANRNNDQAFHVLIADRDSMSSDLLATALTRDGNCHASAVSSSDLLRRLATSPVDLVVIGAEHSHSSINGFYLAHQISSAYPNVLIVILLDQSTSATVIDAFRSGARGVFSRQQPVTEFLACVEHVRKGFIWAAEREAAFLLKAFKCIPSPHLAVANNTPPLTMRELQVVRCVAKGKTNKAIAVELGLSEHTIKNYLFKAFEKLGVSNRVELLLCLTVRGYVAEQAKADDPEDDFYAERTSA
jgi:two-component system, NarL family, nitrate/nitrite response regulator NarL